MMNDPRMKLRYRALTRAQYDDIGAVRTGFEWFNRYMLFPWERPSDFSLVG